MTLSGTGTGVSNPVLSVFPTALDFGEVALGSSKDLLFTVTNTGTGTLTGTVTASSPFSITSGSSFSLGTGASQTITVRFSPTVESFVSSTAAVNSNGGSAVVTLTGTGTTIQTPLLSVTPPSLDFGGVLVGSSLDLIFFVDGLDGFLQRGLSGVNAAPDALASAVTQHIERASAHASGQPGFRDGMSLFVSCGFGRELHLELKEDLPTNWRFESIAAHDLVTLSWLSEFSPLSLWRLLDSREAIEREGTMLSNINGLLNLVAWSRRLDGHLLPHGKLPDEFSPGVPNIVVLGQNAVRDLRHSVMSQWNPRRILDSDKRWLKVRKLVE